MKIRFESYDALQRQLDRELPTLVKDAGKGKAHGEKIYHLACDLITYINDSISRGTSFPVSVLARDSYRHENGFEKITLAECSASKFRVRLHRWPAGASNAPSPNVHDHRFSFVSYVISGAIVNRGWRLCETGAEFSSFVYKPRLGSATYLLEYQSGARIEIVREELFPAGSVYYLHQDTLHSTRIASIEGATTFFIEDRREIKASARVYSQRYPTESIVIDAPSMTDDEYIITVGQVAEHVLPG